MVTLNFTPNLLRHVQVASAQLGGITVREVLEQYFQSNPHVRGYVLDDQGAVRKHVAIFLNGETIRDRALLSDAVGKDDDIFVAQALSGG
jgi:hypothetical protein